ncbi:MAG TPA: bifunctional enoyl-CoA hydratase/phosphate acetyltransferase, partial [Acetobacteraceae bacterium]|nr:bifunctional enoyl-CoA hydratase/phosphate acetyltransferase [Acetobacteraceae bacterium]
MTELHPRKLVGMARQDIHVGLTATDEQLLGERGFELATALFGASEDGHRQTDAAHALIVQSLVLRLAARRLPGPGCDILEQELAFVDDPAIGDRVEVTGTVTGRPSEDTATLAISVRSQRGPIAEGKVNVRVPAHPVELREGTPPDIVVHRHKHLERLMGRSREAPRLTAAVAWPCDRDSLLGPIQAMQHGALQPILVGSKQAIENVARAEGVSLDGIELVEAATPVLAAATSARLCKEGRAQALMKGSLHTDELMAAVVSREHGLRGTRRISHVFAMDVPSYPKPLFITDAAINIVPDLPTKADIAQNAIDMLHALGLQQPKVAILSAVETVNPKIPGTLDAAALCKMADRGQITGAVLDGPLAFDNAISRAAATIKKITSP